MAEASEHHVPGEPPPIRDEAADTPLWLPVVGLCFLVLGAFAILWQAASDDRAPAGEAAVVDEAPAEEAPAQEAPAQEAPAQ